MNLEGIKLFRLTPEHEIKPFDCGDSDLNEFFLKDSLNYQKELLAVTYILENTDETVAFFSIFNDKITILDTDTKSKWKRLIQKAMPTGKRMKSYPAMKIGRLGVSEKYKGQNYGTTILDYLKNLFINNNRTGCKFITVDAYDQSLGFYEKSKFEYLTEIDKGKDTRLMYFDLVNLLDEF